MAISNLQTIHEHILRLEKRADRVDESVLMKTFVQVGPLLPSLMSRNNQILYGRRGTGKTHVFQVLKSKKKDESIVVYIDTRTLGSSSSLYADEKLPLSQRAMSLFKDVLDVLYNAIRDYYYENVSKYSEQSESILEYLDKFYESYTQLVINGNVSEGVESKNTHKSDDHCGISYEDGSLNGSASSTNTSESSSSQTFQKSGVQEQYINYNALYHVFANTLSLLRTELWVLIDEFSELPSALQVLFADMLRHVFCPNRDIVFKIASIEARTHIYEKYDTDYKGLEVGADVFSENLDNILVFGSNEVQSLDFFRNLLFNHINNSFEEDCRLSDTNEMVRTLFTQENVFNELVTAAEGVPRDAINILCEAARTCYGAKITMPSIRDAARAWYKRDKYNSVSQYPQARELLDWIISVVIGDRKARGFMLKAGSNSKIIDYLFDSRILHILKQNVSAKDRPGERFDVYSIDYGCYVELINTEHQVLGLFQEEDNDSAEYIKVPKDDYRSIRRAILDLDEFHKLHKELSV